MARWGRSRREWDFYPVSHPRQAKGGIKAKTRRGEFATTWWAKRWTTVLESFHIGARLSRGKSYARRGQVTDIRVGEGKVEASVQGSRPRPYKVTITMGTLSEADWSKVVGALSREAIHAAKLLAGEMPHEVEEVFAAAGLSLFPSTRKDLKTDCSCPDWSNPCKHIAAVFYLLGEEFDRDPFLIFQLRGMGREELTARLGGIVCDTEPAAPAKRRRRGAAVEKATDAPAEGSLPSDMNAFWGARAGVPGMPLGELRVTEAVAALPRRLGGFPFWRSEPPLLEILAPVYRAAAVCTMQALADAGKECSSEPVSVRGEEVSPLRGKLEIRSTKSETRG